MQREGPLGGRSKAGGLEHDCARRIACEVRPAHCSRQQQRQSIPLQQSDLASRTGAHRSLDRWCNSCSTVPCSILGLDCNQLNLGGLKCAVRLTADVSSLTSDLARFQHPTEVAHLAVVEHTRQPGAVSARLSCSELKCHQLPALRLQHTPAAIQHTAGAL